jgi:glutamate dehydrogenase (NAD(P)+)
MLESFKAVNSIAEKREESMRTAAYIIAVKRLEEAQLQAGLFP